MDELFRSYIPNSSPLHRLDPRTKLVSLMVISILVLQAFTFTGLGLFAAFFVLLAYLSGVGTGAFLRSIRPMLMFFAFIFLMHLFLTEGEPIFRIGLVHPTFEGLVLGTVITTRFVLLILFASLLTATTRPSMITNGIERMLRHIPLNRIGLSSFDIATMMSLAIYFVPVLMDNAHQVRYAQISRGLDIRHNMFRGVSTTITPMIRGSLHTADDLATAMESRCYQGKYRTSLFELRMRTVDWCVLCGISCVVFLFSGYANY
ncbi:MAG TPA: energy-coupling factor transporter transmembrane protein EcfT [Methanosarcinaceae archaeon]|nr:energy-coupling factor transporter transmembrane protein EcfT [Methanosarcinaceae archaeon]